MDTLLIVGGITSDKILGQRYHAGVSLLSRKEFRGIKFVLRLGRFYANGSQIHREG